MFAMLIILLFVAVLSSVAQSAEPANALPYLNSALPTNQRVDDLVARTQDQRRCRLLALAHAAQHREAVHARQADIQHDQIERVMGQSVVGFDALYDFVFKKPFLWFVRVNPNDAFDVAIGLIPVGLGKLHGVLSRMQNGRLRWYAAAMGAGSVAVLAVVLWT